MSLVMFEVTYIDVVVFRVALGYTCSTGSPPPPH